MMGAIGYIVSSDLTHKPCLQMGLPSGSLHKGPQTTHHPLHPARPTQGSPPFQAGASYGEVLVDLADEHLRGPPHLMET